MFLPLETSDFKRKKNILFLLFKEWTYSDPITNSKENMILFFLIHVI